MSQAKTSSKDRAKYKLGLGMRRQVFRSLCSAQDSGLTVTASYKKTMETYDLAKDELRAIEDEGVDKNWVLPELADDPLRLLRLSEMEGD